MTLVLAQTVVTEFPYYMLVYSACRPYFLPNSIRMTIRYQDERSTMIESIPIGSGPVFQGMVGQVKKVLAPRIFTETIKSVLTGSNLFYVMSSL